MPFREVYGGRDKPGRKYLFNYDEKHEANCYLVIDPIDDEVVEKVNAVYATDRKKNQQTGKWDYFIPKKKINDSNKMTAQLVWADIENGWALLGNQEAVDLYSKELGETFNIGDEILLDGRLTDEIKRDFLSEDTPLALWILAKATDASAEQAEIRLEEQEKNSSSSLTSDSENTEASPIRSVGNAS